MLVYAKNKDLVDRIWTGEQRRSRAPVGLPSSPMTPARGHPVVQAPQRREGSHLIEVNASVSC